MVEIAKPLKTRVVSAEPSPNHEEPNLPVPHDTPDSQPQERRFLIIAGGAILATLLSVVFLDRHVGVLALESKMPGDIRAFFQCMSFFGHGTGCLIAASLIWTLDRSNKKAIPLIVGSVLLSGAISTAIKVIVHRPRPFVDPASLGDGITLNEAVFHNYLQSFPSGHTATAFALAMALSLLYRNGKPLFFLFAGLVGLQRVLSQNHFPSDVIAGALIGVTSANVVLYLMRRRWMTCEEQTVPQRQPTNAGPKPETECHRLESSAVLCNGTTGLSELN